MAEPIAGTASVSSICLIDTSVFLNLLDVPNRNTSKDKVLKDFETYAKADCIFLLPMATILETGNHISQNGDGNIRRVVAQRFVQFVKSTFANEAPWRLIEFPSTQEISLWLEQFPNLAGKSKAPNKSEGTSFGDLSIIQDFEKTCKKNSMSEVFIWSLDHDLEAYRYQGSSGRDHSKTTPA